MQAPRAVVLIPVVFGPLPAGAFDAPHDRPVRAANGAVARASNGDRADGHLTRTAVEP